MRLTRTCKVVLLAIYVVGCSALNPMPAQAPPSPLVRAFGDNQFWMTAEEMEYIIGKTNDRIIVPKGFVTDFASIPQPLWSFGLTPHGQYSRAAVIHDFLYWAQGCTKEQADRLMVVAMKESNVGSFDETVIYDGLYIGGKPAWNANAAERKAGLPRIVPAKYLKPPNPNVKWAEYRQELVKAGVKDPEFETRPSYCKYGDSTTVP